MALGVGRGTAERSTSAMTSYWIIGLPATPVSCTLVCPHADTRGCPRPRSAVLGGPLLAGPFASDEAARSLAKMGLVRLPSVSESSSIYGSRILKMTKLAKRDSLLVCHFGGGDVLGTDVTVSISCHRKGRGRHHWRRGKNSLLLFHGLVIHSLSECRDDGLVVPTLSMLRLCLKPQEACVER